MRPYQWIKNVFCFAGVVFGLHFDESHLLLLALQCFFTFCMASSSVYVLNDIVDIESDKFHPKKQNRPLASGAISIKEAWLLFGSLVIAALISASLINLLTLAIILLYIFINIYYSLSGKHIVLLDVFIITFGFLLRVLSGTTGINIKNSDWLILCVITLTLFLGFAKRRAELLFYEKLNVHKHVLKRPVLEHYHSKILDIFIAVTACASILSYSLFVVIGKDIPYTTYTILFVIYGIFRYIYLLYSQEGGQDIARDLLKDKHLIITIILWIIRYIGILAFLS